MTPLTPRQLDVLRFIISATRGTGGLPPSQMEIGAGIGLSGRSRGIVQRHLDALVKKGFLRRAPGIARGYFVLKDPDAGEDVTF